MLLLGAALVLSRASDRRDLPPHLTAHHENMLAFHLRGDAALPPGRWLFFGDSIVQGLPAGALGVPAVNYGIGNDDAIGVAARLPSYDSVATAAAVVLGVGVNGELTATSRSRFTAETYSSRAANSPSSSSDVIPASAPARFAVPAVASAVDGRVGQRLLPRLHLEDALLDGVGGDEAVDEHRLVLPDAVRPRARLRLDRGGSTTGRSG